MKTVIICAFIGLNGVMMMAWRKIVLVGGGFCFASLGWAESVQTGSDATPLLHTIIIEGLGDSKTTISSDQIKGTPSSNQDISSLLQDLPAVRFSESSESSLNRGSMDVSEMSFHGSSPFQNSFTIDGFGATNNLNPAEKNTNLKPSTIAGNSQAYFLDTSLLESVEVYDRNIPVEYGGFTGGVVNAKLKRAGAKNTARVSYRWNTSNMTRQAISEGDERNWGLGKPGYAPEWRKSFYNLSTELRLTEKLGLTIGASKRKSRIARYKVVESEGRNVQEQSDFNDQVDNFLSKLSYEYKPRSFADVTLKYSDRSEHLVSDVLRDTEWKNRHQAQGAGLSINHALSADSSFDLKLGWDHIGGTQQSRAHDLITHIKPGLPTYTSGGYGKNEQSKDTYHLGLRYNLPLLQAGELTHKAYIGTDFVHTAFRFERHQDSYSMIQRTNAAGTVSESNKVLNKQGKVANRYTTASLYAANQMQWKTVGVNLGARVDHDTLFKNTTLSPRVHIDWDVLGTGQSLLSVGRARYYGNDILALALKEGIESLRYRILDSKGNSNFSSSDMSVDYQGLKNPYDDEWSIAWQQRMGNLMGELAYVRRYGRKQVTRETIGTDEYYANNGHSKNDSVALTLQTLQPWQLGPSYWTASASFGWQRTKRNTDYDIGYDSDATFESMDVFYNGVRIPHLDLPLSNYYQPRQLSFKTHTQLPAYGVNWSNNLRWRSKKDSIIYVGRKQGLDSYESARLGSYWTWDTKLSFAPTWLRGPEVSLEVLNVLNKMPPIVATNPALRRDQTVYRSGRELWLQVSYQY